MSFLLGIVLGERLIQEESGSGKSGSPVPVDDGAIELPRDIFPAPIDLGEVLGIAALVLLAIFISGQALQWLRRSRLMNALAKDSKFSGQMGDGATANSSDPPPSPAEIAQLQLLALQQFPLKNAEQCLQFYVQAAFVLRDFLCGQFQIPTRERTTEEVLLAMQESCDARHSDRPIQVGDLSKLLTQCDGVKFAQHTHEAVQARSWLNHCQQYIEDVS